jgi:uncharacterized membrane protein (DUF485 family)
MSSIENRRFNQRFGLVLFFVYSLLYLGFVVLCAFAPAIMEWRPWGGLNLALQYGFGLIFVALFLSIIYGYFCRNESDSSVDLKKIDSSIPHESNGI